MSHDDEDYFLPLEDQRVFGAGIRRKRVPFIRSSEHELNTTDSSTSTTGAASTQPGPSIANTYLSIVLPKNEPQSTNTATAQQKPAPAPASAQVPAETTYCEVCNLPLPLLPSTTTPLHNTSDHHNTATRPHEASLAHQLCLTHSHPPSHLDRTRHGMRYLSAYGWDPDSLVGLGMPGREGIREPVKGRLKVDTVGLGVDVDNDVDGEDGAVGGSRRKKREEEERRKRRTAIEKGRVEKKLNAKEVRKGDLESRKRGDKLREMFYQSDDVQKYLG